VTEAATRSLAGRHTWRRWGAAIALTAAAVPPALVARMVARDGLNVPFLDDWHVLPLLEKAQAGTLRLGDFWAQHNEHRPVLARLLLLGLARLTGWDLRWELGANVAMALATLGVLAALIKQTLQPIAPRITPWIILVTSILTFSLVQWQNWLWGWQVQIFMNALAACVTVWALARFGSRGPRPLLALAAAIAGALSFGSGLTLLALVPFGLALDERAHEMSGSWRGVGITAFVGVALGAVYLVGLEHPPTHPSVFVAFSEPWAFAQFVLAYLGAPLGSGWYLVTRDRDVVVLINALWGAAGVAVMIGAGAWLHSSWPASRETLRPWFLLALYAILSAAMTGLGRLGSGLDQALASRYTTISTLFWVSVSVVSAMALTRVIRNRALGAYSFAASIALVTIAAPVAGASYLSSWMFGADVATVYHDGVRRGGECLRFYRIAPDPCLGLLNPDIPVIRDHARRFEALGLGPFAPGREERAFSSYTVAESAQPAGWLERIEVDHGATEVVVSGWGMDPGSGSAAPAILIVADGTVLGRVRPREARADVATQLGADGLLHSGWTFRFGAFRLGPGSHTVEAYALIDRERIARLGGARTIEVKRTPT
jgi:hypothetical protein